MRNILPILILILFTSCGSIKETTDQVADEKYELCSKLEYNRLINQGPIDGELIYKQNIHSLFENALIKEGHLSEISKMGFSKLLQKANRE